MQQETGRASQTRSRQRHWKRCCHRISSLMQLNRARFTTFDTLADQSSLGDPTFMPWRLQTPSARRALLPARASKRNEILGARSISIFQRRVLHRRRTSVCVWSVDESGKALAGSKLKKKTSWITNSAVIASALKRCCKESSPHILAWKFCLVFE